MGKAFQLAAAASPPSQTPAVMGITPFTMGSAITVFGKLTQGSGNGQLWTWQPEANAGVGEWYPYGNVIVMNSAVKGGKFLERFATDLDSTAYFALELPSGGAVAGEAWLKGARL